MEIFPVDKDRNLATAERMIREACEQGAGLLILPEMFNTGTVMEDRAQAYAMAETIPDGRSVQLLLGLAREKGVYIVASFLERQGPDLFNTAVLAGPEGLVGKYRMLKPCEEEV